MADGGDRVLTAEAFAGTWRLSRRIDDMLAGEVLGVEGTARLVLGGAEGVWDETGDLSLPDGRKLAVARRYLWRFEGDKVEVRFHDGRLFHTFRPAGVSEGTDHPCGEDFYRVTYDFRAWPRWRAVWRVTGPRKDYVSDTLFAPLPAGAG